MNESSLGTIEQIREFLAGTSDVEFAVPSDEAVARAVVQRILERFRYLNAKGQRSVLYRYMQRLSGYSRQHLDRLLPGRTSGKSPVLRLTRTKKSALIALQSLITLLNEKTMQIGQAAHGNPRWAEIHGCARGGVQHPGGNNDNDASLHLEVNKPPRCTLFNALLAKAPSVKWMPTIMDFNFGPDMGRMTGRL